MDQSEACAATRRRFLAGLAACALLPSCRRPTELVSTADKGIEHWRGIGFGIDMEMVICGVSKSTAEELGTACERSIAAMEHAFSLYRDDSELSRLNRERRLAAPSELFLRMLKLSRELESRTLGYFQPAIQGPWQWLMTHDNASRTEEDPQWKRLCESACLDHLGRMPDGSLGFLDPLTQISMNAIGQGFLTDMVAAILLESGVTSALLQLGEVRAIGCHPAGRPWKLAIAGSAAPDADPAEVELTDVGMAVSASDPDRLLIDPVDRCVRRHNRVVSVVSREGAAVADAFATALAVAPAEAWQRLADNLRAGGESSIRIWESYRPVFRTDG